MAMPEYPEEIILTYIEQQSVPNTTEAIARATGYLPNRPHHVDEDGKKDYDREYHVGLRLVRQACLSLARCGKIKITINKCRGSISTYLWEKTPAGQAQEIIVTNRAILNKERHVIENAVGNIARKKHEAKLAVARRR